MITELKKVLKEIAGLLEAGGNKYYSNEINNLMNSDEESIWQYLESNEIWGGSGSVADSGVIENKDLRSKLLDLLIKLGEYQQKEGRVNVRTESWMQAFRNWKDQEII